MKRQYVVNYKNTLSGKSGSFDDLLSLDEAKLLLKNLISDTDNSVMSFWIVKLSFTEFLVKKSQNVLYDIFN